MKIKFLMFSLLSLLFLAGCGDNNSTDDTSETTQSTNESTTSSTTMTGENLLDTTENLESVVVSYEENVLVVARVGNGGDMYRMEVDQEKLQDSSGEKIATDVLTVGTVVTVTFNGIVGFSYPAYIPNYSSIEVTEETDQDTLDAALAAQQDMMATDIEE